MTPQRACRAPFAGVPMRDVIPRMRDNYRGWQEQGFTSAIIDKNGIVVSLMRNDPNGVSANVLAEIMNMEAAQLLMTQGTAAEET